MTASDWGSPTASHAPSLDAKQQPCAAAHAPWAPSACIGAMFKPAGTRRWLVWSGLSAVLLVLGLLAAFHQVVSGAVRQGEAWRQAQAVQKDASWRCKASRRLEERRQCLAVLAGGKS